MQKDKASDIADTINILSQREFDNEALDNLIGAFAILLEADKKMNRTKPD